jgi:undecaprenyl diphosphate synthase
MSSANIIKNLAIIMDGNGRWATQRGLKRVKGHEKGAEVVKDITTFCANHPKIETLTLYAFSTENWRRPKLEVEYLMYLLQKYIVKERINYMENGVKFDVIGDIGRFSPKLQETIENTKELTKNNNSLTQILALNYGSRDEIVRAVNHLINQKREIDEKSISEALDTPYEDIDLLIRTSGEQRVSNFLLWQISYAELFFTPTYWPDFTSVELENIIYEFQSRDRKFGGI